LEFNLWKSDLFAAVNETKAFHRGSEVSLEAGFDALLCLTEEVFRAKRMIFFAGNGASASMAGHYALDFWKNGGVRCQTFHEISQVSAISNDRSYEDVFSFPLERFGEENDAFVGISSSGNSPNVVKGAKQARKMGITVVSFSGFKPDNRLLALSDIGFYVPASMFGFVETTHAALLHYWLDRWISHQS